MLWNPNNHQRLEKFRLVVLTLCHLPLPRLQRNVRVWDTPPPRSQWSMADRHLSRALSWLVLLRCQSRSNRRFERWWRPPEPQQVKSNWSQRLNAAGKQWCHERFTVRRVTAAYGYCDVMDLSRRTEEVILGTKRPKTKGRQRET